MQINWIVAIGAALLLNGFLLAFFGYKVLRIILGIIGFAAGASLVGLMLARSEYPAYVVPTAAVLGGAIVGALLAYPLFIAGLFLQGAALGVLPLIALGITEPPFLAVLAAVCGGTLAVIFRRPVIIVATAVEGAFSIVYGLQALFGRTPALTTLEAWSVYDAPSGFPPPLFAGIVLATFVLGCVVQFRDSRRDDLYASLRETSRKSDTTAESTTRSSG